jgi:hypothetical protein
MFDVTLEAGWRATGPDPLGWLQSYAVRRYGGEAPDMVAAMDVMYTSAYKNSGIDESIIEDLPGSTGGSRNTNATGILAALRLYIAAFSSGGLDPTTGPASYDITDLTRQVLCDLFQDLYAIFSNRRLVSNATVADLQPIADAMLGVIADIDATNAGDVNFLLGTWLADAAKWGFNDTQVANRLYNARNQITLWGPNGEINDYAAKIGWSGLVKDYYLFRWDSYLTLQLACIANGTVPDWDAWNKAMLSWEQAWSANATMYPTEANGVPPLDTAGAMVGKYAGNAAANGFTAHVGMDSVDSSAGAPQWVAVNSSKDMGATGPDCPVVDHGPTGSVAACEAGCDETESCNVVNWSPSVPDCVYRACVDPRNPSLQPNPGYSVFANVAAGPLWKEVPGSTNMAAIGADCPWLAKGPGDSIVACEAACGTTPGCNAFNWNSGDCEMRNCANPMNPGLTPYAGWSVYGNAAASKPIVIGHMWHTDVGVLAFFCETTPGCAGFNSNGKLTSNATVLAPAPGVAVYVKNGAPQPIVLEREARTAPPKSTPVPTPRPLPTPPPSMRKMYNGGRGKQ